MPFKSKAQRRKFHAMKDRGEISEKTVKRWEKHTPKGKKLPERVGKKASWENTRIPHPKAPAAAPNSWESTRIPHPKAPATTSSSWENMSIPHPKGAPAPQPGITNLPQPAATTGPQKSAAYKLGESLAKEAGPMAYVGRKAVMPLLRKLTGWIAPTLAKAPGKTLPGWGKQVGAYGRKLKGLEKEPVKGAFKGRGAKKKMEELLRQQRLYGGIGTAAVGIPALASILGGVSAGRRRQAERELDAAMAKGADWRAKLNRFIPEKLKLQLFEPERIGGLEQVRKVVKPKAKSLHERLGGDKFGIGGLAGATAGVGAGTAVHLAGKKKKKDEKKDTKKDTKKEAQLGTPFMDGFLMKCAEAGLNQKQVADVLEKAAERDDRAGKECKAFLERVAACKE